jgi:hypothetical protein
MIKDLLIASINAQSKYVLSKVVYDKNAADYESGCQMITHTLENTKTYDSIRGLHTRLNLTTGGAQAMQLFQETFNNLNNRFVHGRSGDPYFEKL